MKSMHIKMSVSFIILCAMLLSHFALFSISSVNAQGSSPATAQIPTEQPRALTGREGAVDPVAAEAEAQRMVNEFRAAQQNEQINPPISNTQKLDQIKCGWSDWIFGDSIGCALLWVFNTIVNFIIEIPLAISAAMLNKMSEVNLDGAAFGSPFVTIGWGISRDVANMFFIFFVLWMALATIFQFESYSAKRLLPKLIVVALLVNFSLPIGLFVIRTTNAIGNVFYKTAKGNSTLAQQILNMTQATVTRQSVELTKEQAATMPGGASGMTCQESFKASAVSQFIPKLVLDHMVDYCIRQTQQRYVDSQGGILSYAYTAVFWKLIIGLVSAFVFFAGTIFLLVRYLSLTILLIFGPLAFLFMILPGTQEHWNKWWTKLTQWSFFAPVFFFMIMLSTRVSTEILPAQYQLAKTAEEAQKLPMPSLAFQYMLATGLFIASLFVAQSMGIAMSGTVVGWGRSMARGAGRYAKGKGIQYAKIGAGGVAGGIQSNALLQKTLSSIPLLGGSIARGLGATRAMGEVAEKQRQRQKFGFAEKLSDEGRANYIASERAGAARDMLTKMDEGDRRRTVNALSTQGQIELAQKLRSVQSEALVGNATNNPEVYARLSGEAGPLDSKDYPAKVAKIAHEKFEAENLASDFLRGAAGREYLKTATEDELKAIAKTRQGAEALGGTLAEVARTIHEEVTDARTDMQQRAVPYDLKQLTQTISNQHLSPQTQQYLNTAPGMYEGRMAMKTRREGRENNQEDDDENFMRMLQKAAKKGIFKPEE